MRERLPEARFVDLLDQATYRELSARPERLVRAWSPQERSRAVEVKNTRRIRPEDLRSLRAFKTNYSEAELLLLYRGTERRRIGDVLCLPVDEFLVELSPSASLPG